MNDHPVHRDDITAMNNQGDLKAYMRSLIQPTRTPNPTPKRTRKPAWGDIPKPADHKPGQWPPGTSPPGPPPEWNQPPELWADAVHRYRTEQLEADQETNP
jgi:hypothetical protein